MGAVPLHPQSTSIGSISTTERRQATLLCTELRGLARMSEALEPRLVLTLANEFFRFVAEQVAAQGGEAVSSQHEMLLSMFTRGNPSQNCQQAVRAARRRGATSRPAQENRLAHPGPRARPAGRSARDCRA